MWGIGGSGCDDCSSRLRSEGVMMHCSSGLRSEGVMMHCSSGLRAEGVVMHDYSRPLETLHPHHPGAPRPTQQCLLMCMWHHTRRV